MTMTGDFSLIVTSCRLQSEWEWGMEMRLRMGIGDEGKNGTPEGSKQYCGAGTGTRQPLQLLP